MSYSKNIEILTDDMSMEVSNKLGSWFITYSRDVSNLLIAMGSMLFWYIFDIYLHENHKNLAKCRFYTLVLQTHC